MEILPQKPATLGDVRVEPEQSDAIERARAGIARGALDVAPAASRQAAPPVAPQRGRPPGVRNGEGAPPRIVLRKLSLRHKQAIALVLQGMGREDAAEATGFVPEYITFLLQQPLAREYIAHVNRTVEVQLEALYGKSVEAISGGLRHANPDVKLRAAKLQLQTTGRLEPDEGAGEKTAEDVVQAIMLGVQVNVRRD